jgi:hypothetical protein
VLKGRGFPWRTAVTLVVMAGIAAGGFAMYRSGTLGDLPFLTVPHGSETVPVVTRPTAAARSNVPTTGPLAGSQQTIDTSLQNSPLWQRLKRDFPDWYSERLAESAQLAADSKTEREIKSALLRAVVELRRRHQADALAASPSSLRAIAESFVASLVQLASESTAACYGFISQGEASSAVADLKGATQRAALDAQLATIFAAVSEGRQSPTPRDPPKKEDYDILSGELGKLGWTAADLQLFTDARALSRAAPEKVCQMVQDWFAAQLAVQDEATKVRLLGEALKPVVAG